MFIFRSQNSMQCFQVRKDQFRRTVLETRPEILLTVYHWELLPILEVAKDLGNLPVMHFATDVDLKMKEVFARPLKYPRFALAMPYDVPEARESAAPVPLDFVFQSGYPVRETFLKATREEPVVANMDVVTILQMPGDGEGLATPWPENFATYGLDFDHARVIVVAGTYSELEAEYNSTLTWMDEDDHRILYHGKSPGVTVEIALDRVRGKKSTWISAARLAELYNLADVVITKPGGGVTAEAALMGVPIVFDGTEGFLHWEQVNCEAFATAERALVATTAVEVSRFVRPLVFLLNSYPSHPFPPTVQFAFLRPTVSKKSQRMHI